MNFRRKTNDRHATAPQPWSATKKKADRETLHAALQDLVMGILGDTSKESSETLQSACKAALTAYQQSEKERSQLTQEQKKLRQQLVSVRVQNRQNENARCSLTKAS